MQEKSPWTRNPAQINKTFFRVHKLHETAATTVGSSEITVMIIEQSENIRRTFAQHRAMNSSDTLQRRLVTLPRTGIFHISVYQFSISGRTPVTTIFMCHNSRDDREIRREQPANLASSQEGTHARACVPACVQLFSSYRKFRLHLAQRFRLTDAATRVPLTARNNRRSERHDPRRSLGAAAVAAAAVAAPPRDEYMKSSVLQPESASLLPRDHKTALGMRAACR